MSSDPLRNHLLRFLEWQDAHTSFDAAVAGIPAEVRGTQPADLPYSLWQLLEHLRLTQLDILEFCRNPAYVEPSWPEDYWPSTVAPPSESAWEESIVHFLGDREALKQVAAGPEPDLFAVLPHGSGQTYLRELLLVADHNAYHVGQLIVVRRLLGVWPK